MGGPPYALINSLVGDEPTHFSSEHVAVKRAAEKAAKIARGEYREPGRPSKTNRAETYNDGATNDPATTH
jgi:hypothetical protein